MHCIFFFKQKTAYEMRISDWSSDVCSSDLNLFAAIEAKRSPDAARLLFGLGIRHVGAVTARDLFKGLGAIDRLPGKSAELYAWLVDNPPVEGESDGKFAARKLDAIKAIIEVRADGLGPAVAAALGDFFHEQIGRAHV